MSGTDTIFHKIIRKEIPASILFEDGEVVAFRDINPASPTHILIVPKKTIPTADAVTAADEKLLGHMIVVASQLAREMGIDRDGYRLVVNCGEGAGQIELKHGRRHQLSCDARAPSRSAARRRKRRSTWTTMPMLS